MESDLKILLKFCAAFGIYVQRRPRKSSEILKAFTRIYPLFLMIILSLLTVGALITTAFASDFVITGIVAGLVFLSQMLTQFCTLLEAIWKQEEHEDFLRLLYDIEIIFKLKLKLDIEKTALRVRLRKKLVMLIIILILGLVVFAVNFALITEPGYFWWAQVAVITMRLRFFQLVFYVENLKIFLISLNCKLEQIVCLRCEESKQLLDIDYKSLKSLEILRTLRDLYSSIYEAFQNFNEFAQLSLLAGTASYFVDFTCHLYWTMLALSNLLPIYSIVLAVATIFPLGLNIFLFCYTCQIIKEQSQFCCILVSRLMCSNSFSKCNERIFRDFLNDFTMQLMHQRLEITGKRFFKFDLNCIFGICALIATHLIILIQFTKNNGSLHLNFNETTKN